MDPSPIPMEDERIGSEVVDAAYRVHSRLGPGLYEHVYEVCFVHELKGRGIRCERQLPVPIKYDSIVFDEGFKIDVLAGDRVICELKAEEQPRKVWLRQLLTYLRLKERRLGFIINFDVAVIKDGIQRVVL